MIAAVKDRCTLLGDFLEQGRFFFQAPREWDVVPIQAKWSEAKFVFFKSYAKALMGVNDWNAGTLESLFKQLADNAGIKPGELQLPLRIMLVGGKFGPPVFDIAALLGKEETAARLENALAKFGVKL